jgi:hypothetical protein
MSVLCSSPIHKGFNIFGGLKIRSLSFLFLSVFLSYV